MRESLVHWLRRGGWTPLLEYALIAAIAIVLAKWTWELLAPAPVAASGATATVEERTAGATVKRGLFGRAEDVARPSGAATAGLRLVGAIVSDQHDGGRAILMAEGARARAVAVGDVILPGVIVREIHPDHVVVSRDGISERIALERRAPHANDRR